MKAPEAQTPPIVLEILKRVTMQLQWATVFMDKRGLMSQVVAVQRWHDLEAAHALIRTIETQSQAHEPETK